MHGGTLRRGPGRAGPGPPAQHQRGRKHAQHGGQAQQGGQQRCQHHAHQGRAFAPGHDAAAQGLVATQACAPRLVGNAELAVGQVGGQQAQQRPPGQGLLALHGREEQRPHAQRQHHGRPGPRAQHGAGGAAKQPVAQPAQQRVGGGVEQAGRQQHGPQRGQRHAVGARVVVGQQHVQRQRHKGQGQAQQAIGQALACRQRAGCARCGHGDPAVLRLASSAWRSAGSDVLGESQMPKNRRANSGSATLPATLSPMRKTAPPPGR